MNAYPIIGFNFSMKQPGNKPKESHYFLCLIHRKTYIVSLIQEQLWLLIFRHAFLKVKFIGYC